MSLLITYIILLHSIILGDPGSCSLEVKIENVTSTNGKLIVALFTDEESFLKNEYASISYAHNSDSVSSVTFKNLPMGMYSVSIFHDENGNGVLDKNKLGIPTEKFGFSNNKPSMFGPPTFKDCSFILNEPYKEITITLKRIL